MKNFPISEQTAKTAISAATIVAPTGVEAIMEIRIPETEQTTEITADAATALL